MNVCEWADWADGESGREGDAMCVCGLGVDGEVRNGRMQGVYVCGMGDDRIDEEWVRVWGGRGEGADRGDKKKNRRDQGVCVCGMRSDRIGEGPVFAVGGG